MKFLHTWHTWFLLFPFFFSLSTFSWCFHEEGKRDMEIRRNKVLKLDPKGTTGSSGFMETWMLPSMRFLKIILYFIDGIWTAIIFDGSWKCKNFHEKCESPEHHFVEFPIRPTLAHLGKMTARHLISFLKMENYF